MAVTQAETGFARSVGQAHAEEAREKERAIMHVEAGEWTEDTQDMAQELFGPMTPIAEIRSFYAGVYEECANSEIEIFVGAQMFCEGYELAACENEAQRWGWHDEEMVSAQYDRENYTDTYDAEALADAEQAVRDNSARNLRAYEYA